MTSLPLIFWQAHCPDKVYDSILLLLQPPVTWRLQSIIFIFWIRIVHIVWICGGIPTVIFSHNNFEINLVVVIFVSNDQVMGEFQDRDLILRVAGRLSLNERTALQMTVNVLQTQDARGIFCRSAQKVPRGAAYKRSIVGILLLCQFLLPPSNHGIRWRHEVVVSIRIQIHAHSNPTVRSVLCDSHGKGAFHDIGVVFQTHSLSVVVCVQDNRI
mmetsp:Transcript_3315/g.6030  ORF Transcript_3315/g.6030 Transcript_3315/m.6030 type:complete len:214 (-) Transcript_3315:319-960(-)